jgi:glucose/arabinose dehydrogenase
MNPRTVWSNPPETFTSRVVASGFEDPWEVTYGPDGYLWITERVGKRVVRVNPADGSRKVAVTIDEVHQALAQDGLLGLALHPQLLRGSDFVYVMYTYDADPGQPEDRRAKIRRYTYDRTGPRPPLDILTGSHGPDHGASRIVFGRTASCTRAAAITARISWLITACRSARRSCRPRATSRPAIGAVTRARFCA